MDVTGTLTAGNIKNEKDLLVNGKVSADSIENSGLLDVTGTLAVKDAITNAGSITVTDKASFSAGSVVNNGSLALSGNVTVNTTVTGNAVELASGAVLAGSLTADTLNVGEKGASLAGNAAVNAAVTGGALSISGAGNQLTLKDGSTVGLIVANGTSFQKEDDLDSVVITGAADDTVIIAADGAFDGNTVENAKLVITDLEEDKQIKVKIDIANIISINANELKLLNGVYYYESDNKLMFVEKDAAGFITVTDGSGDLAVKTDDIASITIKEDNTQWANLNIVMESGNTSVTVKNGKKSKDGIDYMEFAIGGILKSDLGGTNNIKFGNYNKVAVNGNIDAISNLTIGNNSFVNIGKFIYDKDGNIIDKNEGDIYGQNNNNAIRIGSDSVVNIAGDIDLAGGRNTLNIGARSDVAIYGDIDGASNFVVGSGKKAKKDGSGADWTNVTINGDYIAAEMNNNLNIGNYVNFTLGGNIENGGVKSGTGTNLRVGTESVMTVAGKADGMSGINTGKKSNVSFAGAVDGTANNNRINVGAEAVFSAGDIDLYGGNNTIVTGKGATFTAGSIENVKTVNIGAQSSFVSDDIADVSRFTVGNGKAATRTEDAKLTEVKVNGEVSMSTGNDNFKVGNNSNVVVADDIIFGAGKDTLTIGMDSKLTVSDISGMDRFNASWGAVLEIQNGANNDVELGLVTGSWDKATIIDDEGDLLVGPANIGSVYENEVDCYEYKVNFGKKLTFEGSEGVEIQYSYNVNGTWTEWVDYNDKVGLQAPGEYRIFVSVAGDYEDKYSKLNYTLEAKLA